MSLDGAVEEYNARFPENGLRIERSPGFLTIIVRGSLEQTQSDELRKILLLAVEALGPGEGLRADLAGVNYICSAGVGALTAAYLEAGKIGRALSTRNVPKPVAAVLDVLGMTPFLNPGGGSKT